MTPPIYDLTNRRLKQVEAQWNASGKLDEGQIAFLIGLAKAFVGSAGVNAHRSGKLVASTGSEDETKVACWHSIETAPKDGTPILVFRDNGCGYDYYVVWWTQSDSEYPWQEESGNSYPDGRFDGWREIIPPATALYTLQAGEEVRDA